MTKVNAHPPLIAQASRNEELSSATSWQGRTISFGQKVKAFFKKIIEKIKNFFCSCFKRSSIKHLISSKIKPYEPPKPPVRGPELSYDEVKKTIVEERFELSSIDSQSITLSI